MDCDVGYKAIERSLLFAGNEAQHTKSCPKPAAILTVKSPKKITFFPIMNNKLTNMMDPGQKKPLDSIK